MKKTAFAVIFAFELLSLVLVGIQSVDVAHGNPVGLHLRHLSPDTPSTELPTLIVSTPKNYSDYYADNTFKLDFIIIEPESWNSYNMGFSYIGEYHARMYLDGRQMSPISNTVADYTATFSNLSETEHAVQIVVEARAYYDVKVKERGRLLVTIKLANKTYITQTIRFQLYPDSKTVSFRKDPQVVSKDPYPSPPTPVPIIISPQNTNYTTNNITQFTLPLDFSINTTASWIGYSLDNQSRITISGNDTLSELSVGLHNITFFASGTFGNLGISNTTYFNIEPAPEPESFPTSLVMASSVTAAVVIGLGVLLYGIKRKR